MFQTVVRLVLVGAVVYLLGRWLFWLKDAVKIDNMEIKDNGK